MTRRGVATRVLFAALAVFACRASTAVAVIPPWQQPDEPAQVAVVQVTRARWLPLQPPDPGREVEILQSMATFDWWRHHGMATPNPLPQRFGVGGGAALSLGVDPTEPYPPTYYAVMATLLRTPGSVVRDLYVMRVMSVLFGLLTIYVAWRATREAVGDVGGAAVVGLLAVHPQFVVSSTTASPDALVNLLGALVWWAGVSVLRGPHIVLPFAGMWAAALVAATSDRMGLTLLAGAFVFSLATLVRFVGVKRAAAVGLVVAVTAAGVTAWLLQLFAMTQGRLVRVLLPDSRTRNLDYLYRFTEGLFDSWWSVLGWVNYSPPPWWLHVAVVLSVVAAVGVLKSVLQREDPSRNALLLVALAMLAMQIVAVFWVYFRIMEGPQGRYLFPWLLPTLMLLWAGWDAWTPVRFRRYLALGMTVTVAVLDLFIWEVVAMRAYAR